MNGTRTRFSVSTFLNRLRSAGLKAQPYVGVPLTVRHRRLRLNWTRGHYRWSRPRWNRVLFTDESRFNVQFADGRLRVWRRTGESMDENNIVERDRYGGGSVMIWVGILICQMLVDIVMKSLFPLRFLFFREEELTFCSKTTLAAMLFVTQCSAFLQQRNI